MVRGILEAVSGAIVGFFLGVVLYYLLVIALAQIIVVSPAKSWLDFNPALVTVLAIITVAAEFGLFKMIFHLGFTIFARIFAVSAMLMSLLLFVITAIRQNPLLPFYGQ